MTYFEQLLYGMFDEGYIPPAKKATATKSVEVKKGKVGRGGKKKAAQDSSVSEKSF